MNINVGSKRKRQLETKTVNMTLSVAHWEALDRMVELSKFGEDGDPTNDIDFLASESVEMRIEEFVESEAKEAERQKRDQEKRERDAEELAKRSAMPTAMPTERTRRGSQAA